MSVSGDEVPHPTRHLGCGFPAFHHREGIALSTITYNDDGNVRPIFYRLSLSEMVVPYGAPEHPHPRKHAFDVYVPELLCAKILLTTVVVENMVWAPWRTS